MYRAGDYSRRRQRGEQAGGGGQTGGAGRGTGVREGKEEEWSGIENYTQKKKETKSKNTRLRRKGDKERRKHANEGTKRTKEATQPRLRTAGRDESWPGPRRRDKNSKVLW